MTSTQPLHDPWSDEELATQEPRWQQRDIRELRDLQARVAELPETAPNALLAVRLSVLTEETTSPVRTELDLFRMAIDRRSRPVGVARDLGVSATKIPPWKREELGEWINNRSPEFDEILFWKQDRFVRSISDLHMMIEWCKDQNKVLASKHDPIDLSTEMGTIMATLVAGIARIEAVNTGVRIGSVWEHARKSKLWLIGTPVYGYTSKVLPNKDRILVPKPDQKRVLRWVFKVTTRRRNPLSLYRVCKILNRAGIRTRNGGVWKSGNLKKTLRNPALMGYRVEAPPNHSPNDPPSIIYSDDGDPLRVAEGIFTKEEFDLLQQVLKERAMNARSPQSKRTKFLGVFKCGKCGANWFDTEKRWTRASGEKMMSARLRCSSYLNGTQCGMVSISDPEKVYTAAKKAVLEELGDYEIIHREYANGSGLLARKVELETKLKHYMDGLEPGGRFSANSLLEKNALSKLDEITKDLAEIDPEETKDRWVYKGQGTTYRKHWETEGDDQMEDDLRRGGITFVIYSPEHAELLIPEDVKERLVVKDDFFKKHKI